MKKKSLVLLSCLLLVISGCGQGEMAIKEAPHEKSEVGEIEGIESMEYDPAISSTPGFPIIVFWNEDNIGREVKLTCSQGELLNWNMKSGKTRNLGKTHDYKKDEDIYWSPLAGESMEDSTIISATSIEDGEEVERGRIEVFLSDNGTYKAKTIK